MIIWLCVCHWRDYVFGCACFYRRFTGALLRNRYVAVNTDHCSRVLQLINAGITSGAKGALDLWRRQSVSSLASVTDELSPDEGAAAVVVSPVSCFYISEYYYF